VFGGVDKKKSKGFELKAENTPWENNMATILRD
jgi:hypothetical protein